MRSYLKGIITGGVFVFALFVLVGATDDSSEIGRYQMSTAGSSLGYGITLIIDSTNGKMWLHKTMKNGWKELNNTNLKERDN